MLEIKFPLQLFQTSLVAVTGEVLCFLWVTEKISLFQIKSLIIGKQLISTTQCSINC